MEKKISREIHLKNRPVGMPIQNDFELVQVPIPQVGENQLLVQNIYMGKWISQGKIQWKETIVDGIENATDAFLGLFKGKNLGKMIVRVGPDPAD